MNDYYDDELPRGDEPPYINRTGEFLRLCADWETEEALTPAQRVSELERAAEIATGECMSARTDAAYHDLGRAQLADGGWRLVYVRPEHIEPRTADDEGRTT